MRITVGLKITIAILLSLAIQAVVLMWFSLGQTTEDLRRQTEADVRLNMTRLQQTLGFLARKQEAQQLQEQVTALSSDTRIESAYLVDEANKVIASTRVSHVGRSLLDLLQESKHAGLKQRLPGVLSSLKASVWDDGHHHMHAAAPIVLGRLSPQSIRDDRIGYLVMMVNLEWIDRQAGKLIQKEALPVLLVMLFATVLVILYFHNTLSRRLHSISQETLAFVLGEPFKLKTQSGNDELSDLQRSFSIIIGQINEQHNRLRQSEQRLKNSQQLARMGNWDLDLQTNTLVWSDEVYELFGYDKESFAATYEAFLQAVHPDDRERVNQRYIQSLHDSADGYELDHRVIHQQTSEVLFVHEKCEHIKDAEGRIIQSSGMVLDITDRHQAEVSLLETEERFRQLAENVREVFWIGAPDWSQVFYVSPAYESVWGVTVDELYNDPQSWKSYVHADDRESVDQAIRDKANGVDSNPEFPIYRIVRPDGTTRWISARAYPIQDNKGDVVRIAGVAEDVTAQHQQEEQLRRTQKMEALGKLTGGIAHDFNNMMSVVLGYAELLKSVLPKKSGEYEYADEIHRAGERARKLTAKLLAFSRRRATQPEPCNINEVLREEQHMLEKTLTVQIQLEYELADDIWTVALDKSALEDAILNMSINAMHAMPEGGQLFLQTANMRLEHDRASLLGVEAGDYVSLLIRDNGSGMDAETLERLFDPFFTTKGEGTGLGMSQVYGFVQQSGGAIDVESAPGQGTRVNLYFPRADVELVTAEKELEVDENTLIGEETILVVDDEAALVDMTQTILEAKGYKVLAVSGGQQALQVLQSQHVDLILSDVIMPGMDGYQLAAEAGRLYPQMPIQLISGYSDTSNSSLVDEALSTNKLIKPVDAVVLLKRLRELLD